MKVHRDVITSPEAFQETKQAYHWYEAQELGLGLRFLAAFDRAVESVVIQPDIYSRRFGNVRAIKVKKFPYLVYYEHNDRFIFLHSVFHESQHPSRLNRLRNPDL